MAGRYVVREAFSGGMPIQEWNDKYVKPYVEGPDAALLWHTSHLDHLLGRLHPDFKDQQEKTLTEKEKINVWDVEAKIHVWVLPHQVAIRFTKLEPQYNDFALRNDLKITPTVLGTEMEPQLIKWQSYLGSSMVPFDVPLAVPKRPTQEGVVPFSDAHSAAWIWVNYAKLWLYHAGGLDNLAPNHKHICVLIMNALHSIGVQFFGEKTKSQKECAAMGGFFRLMYASASVWFNIHPEILGPFEALLSDAQPTDNLERSIATLLHPSILSLQLGEKKISEQERCLRMETLIRSILLRWYKNTHVPPFQNVGRGGRGGGRGRGRGDFFMRGRGGRGRGRGEVRGRGGGGYDYYYPPPPQKKALSFVKHSCTGLFLCTVLLKHLAQEPPQTSDAAAFHNALEGLSKIKRISDVSDILPSIPVFANTPAPLPGVEKKDEKAPAAQSKDDVVPPPSSSSSPSPSGEKEKDAFTPPGGLEFTQVQKRLCSTSHWGVISREQYDSNNPVHVAGAVLTRIMRSYGFMVSVQMMCDFYESTLNYAHKTDVMGVQSYVFDTTVDKTLYDQLVKKKSQILHGSGFTLETTTKRGYPRKVSIASSLVTQNEKMEDKADEYKVSSLDPTCFVGVELTFQHASEMLQSPLVRYDYPKGEKEEKEGALTGGLYVMRSQILKVVIHNKKDTLMKVLLGKDVSKKNPGYPIPPDNDFYIKMQERVQGPQYGFYSDAACETTPLMSINSSFGMCLSLIFKYGPLEISIIDSHLLFL